MKKSWSLSGKKEGFKLFIFHFSFDYLIDEWWGSMQAAYFVNCSTSQLWVRNPPGQP